MNQTVPIANVARTPKRVLVMGMTENPGGIESLLLNVLKVTDQSKIRFDFLCNTEVVAFEDVLLEAGAKIYRVTARRQSRRRFYRDLDELFREHAAEYDAIWQNVNSLANIDYLVYAKRYGIPVRIIHCHNSQSAEGFVRRALHVANRSRIRKYATHFWSVSDEASEWFYGSDYEKLPHYRVINNAIDIERYAYSEACREQIRTRYDIPEDAVVLGNVGRLAEQKNQALVLRVADELLRRNRNVYVMLVGEGNLREALEAQASNLGISNQVKFVGAVADVAPFYSAFDLFLFPSLFEGLSIAFLEAQANGLPCLISRGIPQRACVNENIGRCDISNSVPDWTDAAEILLTAGRTPDIRLKDSDFDLKNRQNLFDSLFSK